MLAMRASRRRFSSFSRMNSRLRCSSAVIAASLSASALRFCSSTCWHGSALLRDRPCKAASVGLLPRSFSSMVLQLYLVHVWPPFARICWASSSPFSIENCIYFTLMS